MSDAPPYIPLWPVGAKVRLDVAYPTEVVRKLQVGATGRVEEPDHGWMEKNGKKWQRWIAGVPRIRWADGELHYVALHQIALYTAAQ